jgi:hypothetical protein
MLFFAAEFGAAANLPGEKADVTLHEAASLHTADQRFLIL